MSIKNRLRLELETSIRLINNEIINPEIDEINVEKIKPVVEMVARARAEYLKFLFEITDQCKGEIPSTSLIKNLSVHRKIYEELVQASQALDTAIERGYLDVEE